MEYKPNRKLPVVVTLFLSCLFLVASFGLQLQTKNVLTELAAVSVTVRQSEQTAVITVQTTQTPQTTAVPSVLETEPVVTQMQNTESATVKATAAKQVNTTKAMQETTLVTTEKNTEISQILIVNTNTKKIHSPDCSYAQNIKEENRAEISRDELPAYEQNGYTLCGHCKGCAK
ncbi:MAG: hypothetical protein ACI4K9_03435 [Candidatus Fimenecus sp.]